MASTLSDALARHKTVTRSRDNSDRREAARLLSCDATLLDGQWTNGEGLKFIPELRPDGIDRETVPGVTG